MDQTLIYIGCAILALLLLWAAFSLGRHWGSVEAKLASYEAAAQKDLKHIEAFGKATAELGYEDMKTKLQTALSAIAARAAQDQATAAAAAAKPATATGATTTPAAS